jgi:hypothetical protein
MLGFTVPGTAIVNHVPLSALLPAPIFLSRVPAVHQSGGVFAHIWTHSNRRMVQRVIVYALFIFKADSVFSEFWERAKHSSGKVQHGNPPPET